MRNIGRGPRWASVNLGIFICMQCSGIHRSLGVHISKVRSATLDTWLPEQVAFIQSMGNEKANSYWEAELPPNYDRVGIENFIRAKYEEKRWVPRNQRSKSQPRMFDERAPSYGPGPMEKSGHQRVNSSDNSFEERTIQASSRNENLPATRISLPVPRKGLNSVAPVRGPETVVVAPAGATTTPSTVIPPKFECATDLFNMISIDDAPSENASGSGAASTDDIDWAGFQSAGNTSATDKNDLPQAGEKNAQTATGIENLFDDSPPTTTNQVPEKPQKDVKNDIMSLFDKSNTLQPYAMHHQQQLALLAHQQSLLMAAAAKSAPINTQQSPSNGAIIPSQQQLALLAQQQSLLIAAAAKGAPGNSQHAPSTTTSIPTQQQLALLAHQQSLLMAAPENTQQLPSTGSSIHSQAWPNIGYQIPGIMMPVGAQADLQKLSQTMQSGQTQQVGNNVASSSFYALGQVTPASGAATNGASKPQSASPVSSMNYSHTGKDYDFSSLTQGLFTKR
ncbi:ADP-ribosylation factor GTPase-activating protein AGD5-like isoform X2 [Hibiscus syriacus]|uniref:ADP-ribosylation factor GTPase-activating protein AGD5-like isoform X2 n=1 Tax=Hibiscus syriacus TaxID=106335 RepID=UPI0019222869|nr:ADP-ribosylation factor GTPase-activating protein AGD5-like isoform X2 [Hibiscus syriacus]